MIGDMSMSTAALRRRLSRLEEAVQEIRARQNQPKDDDPNLLKMFESLGKQGYFRHEPDFPLALDNYRQVLANSSPQPSGHSSIEVNKAFFWLHEMFERARTGIPPVTENEFRE